MLDVKSEEQIYKKFFSSAFWILIFLLLCRIISIWLIPLNDSTEARYGEIARKMLETGNWVTPLHDYGVPFWAKPPLSTWLSALSMKFFGVNEFAARLPGLILSLGILWLIWSLAKKHSGSVAAMISVLVLSGTLYFFLNAGTVMTDPSLIFCTTLVIVSFWRAVVEKQRVWSWLFFVGLGLGLLAKGPIAIVLAGIPIFFWVLLRNEWINLWKRLPWITGTLITLAIALPWYILAEIRTPGFLNYFIIGENLNRFLKPGWTGDKYGMAHNAHWGMIWFYAAVGIFPWNILGGFWLVKYWKKLPSLVRDNDGWMCYLILCVIMPLLFFTFASNIIYPYVFPSLPAFALLFAELWRRSNPSLNEYQWIIRLSVSCGLIFLLATLLFQIKPELVAKSQKSVIAAWLQQHPSAGSNLIYWDYKKPYSAQFYAAGKIVSANNLQQLCPLLSNNLDNYLVIESKKVDEFPVDLFSKFIPIKTLLIGGDKMILVHCPVLTC